MGEGDETKPMDFFSKYYQHQLFFYPGFTQEYFSKTD